MSETTIPLSVIIIILKELTPFYPEKHDSMNFLLDCSFIWSFLLSSKGNFGDIIENSAMFI